jgi:hypothetical protein
MKFKYFEYELYGTTRRLVKEATCCALYVRNEDMFGNKYFVRDASLTLSDILKDLEWDGFDPEEILSVLNDQETEEDDQTH